MPEIIGVYINITAHYLYLFCVILGNRLSMHIVNDIKSLQRALLSIKPRGVIRSFNGDLMK